MDSFEIAKQQLDRLNERTKFEHKRRNGQPKTAPKKRGRPSTKVDESAAPIDDPSTDTIDVPHKEEPFDIKSYTIEWDDDMEGEITPSYSSKTLPIDTELEVTLPPPPPPLPAKRVIKKKIVWDPATNNVISTESKVETMPVKKSLAKHVPTTTTISPPAAKKKRSEVDKLLGDEGVQVIMRDQQISIEDNGTLVNIQKSTKTRNQRNKQEEPEKTLNDWNVCSMIVRRRSSSFSTDSFLLQETETDAKEDVEVKMTQPKITNLFQSMKAKINKSISDNFDTFLLGADEEEDQAQQEIVLDVKEPNNNTLVVAPIKRKQARLPKAFKKSPTLIESKVNAVLTPKKATPPKMITKATKKFTPKYVSVHSQDEGGFIQLKVAGQSGRGGLLSTEVCTELIAVLEQQLQDKKCNLVLLGPLKFQSVEESNEDSVEERRLLETLAAFTKPIFAAVQGTVEGLGVTMLPLFDLVFTKYGAEFCCARDPLAGMSILMGSAKVDKNRISELLFLGESATSTQAVAWGLVTREISSKNDKDFEEKVMQITKETVQGKYTERIRVLKKLWADSHLEQLLKDLSKETTV